MTGCTGETLDGGSSARESASSSGTGAGNGAGTISVEPLTGTIAGRHFEARSVELRYSSDHALWFLSIDNYANTCGVTKERPDPDAAMTVNMSLVTAGAGTSTIALGDGHAATFQIGIYETSDAADTRPAEAGLLRLDAWDPTPGATIPGALKLSGPDSAIEGVFTATVCPSR